MQMIMLQDVLAAIDSGEPFGPIAFVTCDKKQGTGGEWIEVRRAVKHSPVSSKQQADIDRAAPASDTRRDPRHYENSTRNIRLPNGAIRKVHIRLITMFNNKIVT